MALNSRKQSEKNQEREKPGKPKSPSAFCNAVLQAYLKIRALKIQGAENIANAAVQAFAMQAAASKQKNTGLFLNQLRETQEYLSSSRPTEPAMRNQLRILFNAAQKQGSLEKAKNAVQKKAGQIIQNSFEAKKAIAKNGASLVENGCKILVHCHSSSVMDSLKEAFLQGKKFEVFCTESRPFFQGRISCKELSSFGIPATLIVDDSALFFMKTQKISLALVGADAVAENGDLVNKIGTSMIALAAKEAGAKFYSCTRLHKYDEETKGGKEEPIEFRDATELLADLPPVKRKAFSKVRVLNPAFDFTPAGFVDGFVTESGIFTSQEFVSKAKKCLKIK